jgi:hypothetical protein
MLEASEKLYSLNLSDPRSAYGIAYHDFVRTPFAGEF